MRLLRMSLAAALLCAASFVCADGKETALLPQGMEPISYDLHFTPDTATWTTQGEETIAVRVDARATRVVLNWEGLSISDATIDGLTARVDLHTGAQQVWLSLREPLSAGTHRIAIRFRSAIGGWSGSKGAELEQDGFYNASSTRDPFLVTFFEASTARKMFPCFDEPRFRAPITLHVTAPREWTVVSNMPGTRRAQGPAVVWDFSPTPAMPVYLLTLDAGRMSSLEGKADGIPLRVFAAEAFAAQHQEQLREMLADARRLLHFYDGYFGVRYPLPKLDLVLAPNGLYTALEQWGAITYYSPGVLGDDDAEQSRRGRDLFGVLAHEMAHQWFGDLVGMHWWNDVFVAEGLAEFAQERADAQLVPSQSWWVDDDSSADGVMSRGITAKVRPITDIAVTDLESDDENAFDTAAYYKSAAAVRMWEAYLGERAFQKGLRRYLRANAGRAVTVADFWKSFSDRHAAAFGAAWIAHPGFPVVTVASSCRAGHRVLTLAQRPFTDGRGAPLGYMKQIWPVPVIVEQGARRYRLMLDRRSMRATLGPCVQSPHIDVGLRPYYRLRYTGAALNGYIRSLASASAPDRANAVRDARQLFEAGDVPAGYFLRLVPFVPYDDRMLLRQVGITLDSLILSLPHGPERESVAVVVRRVAEPVVAEQLRDDTRNDTAWPLSEALMDAGDASLASSAAGALERMGKNTYLESDTMWIYAGIAASRADAAVVMRMERNLRLPLNPMMRLPDAEYFYLTHVAQPELVRSIITYYHGDPGIVFGSAQCAPQAVWSYVRTHATDIRRRLPPSQQGWELANGVATSLWDVVPPAQMRRFLERSLGPGYSAEISAAVAEATRRRSRGDALSREIDAWR